MSSDMLSPDLSEPGAAREKRAPGPMGPNQ